MVKIWYRNPSKSEVIGRTDKSRTLKKYIKNPRAFFVYIFLPIVWLFTEPIHLWIWASMWNRTNMLFKLYYQGYALMTLITQVTS